MTQRTKWISGLPVQLFVCGVLLKAALVVGWRITRSATILKMATVYDPLSFLLAEGGVGLIFDQRRIAPTTLESLAFEALLILGFGLQCLLLGIVLRAIFVRRPRRL